MTLICSLQLVAILYTGLFSKGKKKGKQKGNKRKKQMLLIAAKKPAIILTNRPLYRNWDSQKMVEQPKKAYVCMFEHI